MGMTKDNSGYGIAFCFGFYTIGGIVGGILTPLLTRRFTVLLTLAIGTIANLLIGPS